MNFGSVCSSNQARTSSIEVTRSIRPLGLVFICVIDISPTSRSRQW
ncbi:hypothetical protein ACFQ1I_18985 [Kitasatospora arboriphila]